MSHFLQIAQLLQDVPTESERWQGGGGGGVLTVLFVILIGCAAAAWWVLKRTGVPTRKGSGQLDIVETKPLGGRQFLVVAQHGHEKFLLGVCPGRIDFLTTLKDDSETTSPEDFETKLAAAEEIEE